jgi:hypothetical protein
MASARLRRRCNEASSRMPQDFGADRLLEARARRPKYDSGEKALLREDWAATPESYFGLAKLRPEFGRNLVGRHSLMCRSSAPMALSVLASELLPTASATG